MKVNIHYVLNNESIETALYMLNNNGFPKGINAVIFLIHKPVGLGKEDNVLKYEDTVVRNFFNTVTSKKYPFKIGFDSCSVPALINFNNNFNICSVDTCEAARWSMYITSELNVSEKSPLREVAEEIADSIYSSSGKFNLEQMLEDYGCEDASELPDVYKKAIGNNKFVFYEGEIYDESNSVDSFLCDMAFDYEDENFIFYKEGGY